MPVRSLRTQVHLVGFGLVFGLPIVLATLLYLYRDHFPLRTTHTGQIVSPAVPLALSTTSGHTMWRWIYLTREDAAPQEPQLIQNLHTALGRHKAHLVLQHCPANAFPLPAEITSTVASTPRLLLVDPHNRCVFAYTETHLNTHPKGILRDAKKLLKATHVR